MKTKFEIGTYETRSLCDHECVFQYEIVRRTEKSIWVRPVGGHKVTRRGVFTSIDGTTEKCFPEGKYWMCPVLSADRREMR